MSAEIKTQYVGMEKAGEQAREKREEEEGERRAGTRGSDRMRWRVPVNRIQGEQ